ncbi:MAG: hypothetical protein ACRDS0_03885 [Pseudonocardiaceae bacterium]
MTERPSPPPAALLGSSWDVGGWDGQASTHGTEMEHARLLSGRLEEAQKVRTPSPPFVGRPDALVHGSGTVSTVGP